MKTKEELNALKKEVETVNKKLAELTDEELAQIIGGENDYEMGYQCKGKCDGSKKSLLGCIVEEGKCPYNFK